MTTKASGKSKPSKAPAARRNIPVAVLAIAGLILTSALLFLNGSGTALPYCSAGSSCDIVQSSRWSRLLGVPVAAWGWIVYAAIAACSLFVPRVASRAKCIVFFATIAFGVSLYLNLVSAFAIKAMCMYCLVSFAIVIAIYALSWREVVHRIAAWRLRSSVVAALVVLFMVLHFEGVFDPAAGPEDPYLKALAEHLSAEGVRFYGAYWCPHCQQQKELFGGSASRLPYTECSPNGQRGAPATECVTAGIRNYPTWVIYGQRYERTMLPRQLARYSGFESPPDATAP